MHPGAFARVQTAGLLHVSILASLFAGRLRACLPTVDVDVDYRDSRQEAIGNALEASSRDRAASAPRLRSREKRVPGAGRPPVSLQRQHNLFLKSFKVNYMTC
ncbi:MAG: hypothetical protein ACTHKB_08630, partial [Burkholderiaceae bacterium]